MLYCIILYCITLHYITLHYITLHYITLYYIILYYIIYVFILKFRISLLIDRGTENLRACLKIIEAYLLLCPQEFMQVGPSLLIGV